MMGLEPTTPGTTIRCSAIELHPPQICISLYIFGNMTFMVRQTGLEPMTRSLEGCCSIQLSYWRRKNMVAAQGFGPRTYGL